LTHNFFEGGLINLFGFVIIILLSLLLCVGVKQSARFNACIVLIKLITISLFVVVATFNINIDHLTPFLPFGWSGVVNAAALVFFAYIGFDALSTTAPECLTPQRSIPIGIIVSLLVCTLVYIVVSGLLTAIVPYDTLNVSSPVAAALLHLGYQKLAGMIAVGAIAGLTTVMLVMFYGLTRICLAMAEDGLLPTALARIHANTHTPTRLIILSGLIMATIAGLAPIDRAAELVNIGTLTAFVFVCVGVMVFRITQPQLPRPFRLPLNPLIPLLGTGSCLYLMLHLPAVTWWRFIIWTVLGLIVYFTYSQQHSKMNPKQS
jgi:APA family basic amino acid/polyamine antiporter